MADELRVYSSLPEDGLVSPSGEWMLRYGSDGCARLVDRTGAVRWVAGGAEQVAGRLRLLADGDLAVYRGGTQSAHGVPRGGDVIWRTGPIAPMAEGLRVTDDGDLLLVDSAWLPLRLVLGGAVEATSLGDRVPVSAITLNRYLRRSSRTADRTVARMTDGGLMYTTRKGSLNSSERLPAEVADSLDQPGAELTWRFLGKPGLADWRLALVAQDETCLWADGPEQDGTEAADHEASPTEAMANAALSVEGEWFLPSMEFCCVTLVRDIDPDEVLRRFGAADARIWTATWLELLDRARFEETDWQAGDRVMAAFSLGPHVLLVESYSWDGVLRPDVSAGTSAVSCYEGVNGDTIILVSRDGDVLAQVADWQLHDISGSEPEALTGHLADMDMLGSGDEVFDVDMLDLFRRLADLPITAEDVSGPARVAIFQGSSLFDRPAQ